MNISKIKEYLLENTGELQNVVQELNSWNGCLEQFNVWENDEDFFDTYFDGKPMDAVRAAHYGDYNYNDTYVRFDGYGNLESLNESQIDQEMKDSIDEIISELVENWQNLSLDSELEELLDEDEDEDEEVKNTWENYGDINPIEHGGMFVMKDNEIEGRCYYVIHTTPLEQGQLVIDGYIDLDDEWIDWKNIKSTMDTPENADDEYLATDAMHYYGSELGDEILFDTDIELISFLENRGIENKEDEA